MQPLGHVTRRPRPALALRGDRGGGRGAILAAALLTVLATGEAVGQPGGLFREAAPAAAVARPDLPAVSDSITLRRRLVAIDFGQLTLSADTAATFPGGAAVAPSGVLTLNLFGDASFTGLVRVIFTSTADLPRKLRRYIDAYSKRARPFRWKYASPAQRITHGELSSRTVH